MTTKTRQLELLSQKIANLKEEARQVLREQIQPAQEAVKRDRTDDAAQGRAKRGFARVNELTAQIRDLETRQRRLAAQLGVPAPDKPDPRRRAQSPRRERSPRGSRKEQSRIETLLREAQQAGRLVEASQRRVAETERKMARLREELEASLENQRRETREAQQATRRAQQEAAEATNAVRVQQDEAQDVRQAREATRAAEENARRAQKELERLQRRTQGPERQDERGQAVAAEQRENIAQLRARIAELEAQQQQAVLRAEEVEAEAAAARAAVEIGQDERAARAEIRERREAQDAAAEGRRIRLQLQENADVLRRQLAVQNVVPVDASESEESEKSFDTARQSQNEEESEEEEPAGDEGLELQRREERVVARPNFDREATYELPLPSQGRAGRRIGTFDDLAAALGFGVDDERFADIIVFDKENEQATQSTTISVLQRAIGPYLAGIEKLSVDLKQNTNLAKAAVWSLVGNKKDGTRGLFDFLADGARSVAEAATQDGQLVHKEAVFAYADVLNWLLIRVLTGVESEPTNGKIPGVREGNKARKGKSGSPFSEQILQILGNVSLDGNALVVGGDTLFNLIMQVDDVSGEAVLLPAFQALFPGQDVSNGVLGEKFLRTMASDMFEEGGQEQVRPTAQYNTALSGTKTVLARFYQDLPTARRLEPAGSALSEFLETSLLSKYSANYGALWGYLTAKAVVSVPQPARSFLVGTVPTELGGAGIGRTGRNALVERLVLRDLAPGATVFQGIGSRPGVVDETSGLETYLRSATDATTASLSLARSSLSFSAGDDLHRSELSFGSLFRARQSIWATLSDRQGKAALYSRASKFVSAAQSADDLKFALSDAPSGMRYTAFVPDNDAWRQAALLGKIDANAVNDVLRSHVLVGEVAVSDVPLASDPSGTRTFTTFEDPGEAYMTLERKGKSIIDRVRGRPQRIVANGREMAVLQTVSASNGVIYLIDAVIPQPSGDKGDVQPRRAKIPEPIASRTRHRQKEVVGKRESKKADFAQANERTGKEIAVRIHALPSGSAAPAALPQEKPAATGVLGEFHARVAKATARAAEARNEEEACAAVGKLGRWVAKQPSAAAVRKHISESAWHAGIDAVQDALADGNFFAADGEPGDALESLCQSYYD